MLAWLTGKKTYIVAAISIIAAWVNVWAGTTDAHTAWQLTEGAVLAVTLRHGITTTKGQ